MNPLVIIPARLDSQRFPRKVLEPIDGVPMVVRVARAAKAWPVWVATPDEEVVQVCFENHIHAMLTGPADTGSDRAWLAYEKIVDLEGRGGRVPPSYTHVIVLQGDMPYFPPEYLDRLCEVDPGEPYVTLAAPWGPVVETRGGATMDSFHRLYAHVGIYRFTVSSLEGFHRKPRSAAEITESLEQLRVGPWRVERVPHHVQAVDWPDDLEAFRGPPRRDSRQPEGILSEAAER